MSIILLEKDISPEHEFCKYDLVGDKKRYFSYLLQGLWLRPLQQKTVLKKKTIHIYLIDKCYLFFNDVGNFIRK